ncbi:MAG: HAMP domain-containing histidine kinase [Ignavibacteriaceae bacterium]|nr:HAMP domain-containing histidine kinase [Ignavibacteriaceae bacterium]
MKNDLSSNQKEKENMLAQIAHEIRNPLGGIELLTNLSKEDLAKGQVKEEYLNKILSEIHGLKSLITSFLNYSRPSPSVPSHTSIPQVINEVKNIFQNDMNRKNIQLKLEIETPSVWFDDNHLKQVIINLFSNAVEAANFNSEIAIKSFINNSCNYISISNSGIVIPQENIGKIFNPFFTTKKEGTGLGLAICKKLCSENNANLYVESSHEHGTKFTIVKEINNEQ